MERSPARRTRREFLRGSLALAGLGLLSGCGVASPVAQQAKVHRIGYLAAGSRQGVRAAMAESLLDGLRELGYVEGHNITIDYRFADTGDQLPALAAELVGLNPELIVASGTPAVFAAAEATKTVPIVMGAIAADPVAGGLAASLARPGGNVTGMSAIGRQTAAKRLDLLRQTLPGLARVAVLWNPTTPGHGPILDDLEQASRTLGIRLGRLEVRAPEEIEPAVRAAGGEQAQALFVVEDPVTINRPKLVADLAAQHRLPAIYAIRESVEAGGLMAYAPNVLDQYHRAATHVDKILKGARPGDLPIEQAVTFDLAVNLAAARALGLAIPESVLQQATEVIE